MTRAPRRVLLALGALTALALVAAIAAPIAAPITASARAEPHADAREAARLVRAARHAAEQQDFTGAATVTWSGPTGRQRARVQITNTDGAVAITTAGGGAVFDEGRRTYLRDHLGWTGLVVEPKPRPLPAPDHRWDLAVAGSRTVAGRPATLVVASRPDGAPAQRLTIDDATGLLLGREVVGPDGAVERSVRFSQLEPRTRPGAIAPPRDVRNRTAPALSSTPDGYRAPASVAGFELVTRSRHPDGVLLYYSDGLFSASVFEQQGELDWSGLPPGGRDSHLADTRTRTYREPSGDVAVWAHDGLVYTCVTDAPSDVFDGMVRALSTNGRSVPEAVVDFVLGPFGWG